MGDDGKLVKVYEYDEYGNTTDGGEESFINEVTFTGSVRAVSYTHLDVYKRQ